MLVDLARNDVGRVVKFGTEQVDELMTLERYSHVMHLTSQVAGDLADGRNAVDVLRATFPAGTVSGAPKVRAMEIIDELEPVKRGPYAGVVGYLDFSGNLDTAIAIRTMVWRGGARERAGRRRDRRRLRSGRRGPRVPQQGARRCSPPRPRPATSRRCRRRRRMTVDRGPRRIVRHGSGAGSSSSSGPDATSFLQSLVSQDLDPVADGGGVHSLLLHPQGKLDVEFRALRVGDEWWLDCEAGVRSRCSPRRCARYRIRVKAEIDDRTATTAMVSVRGAGRRRARCATRWASISPTERVRARRRGATLRVVRVGWPGVRRASTCSGRRARCDALAWPEPFDPARFEARADRARRPAPRRRRRRLDDPPGGVPRARRGVVHEGLLPRPGARLPDRHARSREPVPARSALRAADAVPAGRRGGRRRRRRSSAR